MSWGKARVLRFAAVAATLYATTAGAAEAAETRCGWIENPTPANWWLIDRDGQWIIGSQGGRQAEGMDLIPDLTTRDWVKTNGSYGYGCVCMSVDVDRADSAITTIHSVRQLKVAKCEKDPKIPPR